jgi:hypothetical protein
VIGFAATPNFDAKERRIEGREETQHLLLSCKAEIRMTAGEQFAFGHSDLIIDSGIRESIIRICCPISLLFFGLPRHFAGLL